VVVLGTSYEDLVAKLQATLVERWCSDLLGMAPTELAEGSSVTSTATACGKHCKSWSFNVSTFAVPSVLAVMELLSS
jgi:hypothetical protein